MNDITADTTASRYEAINKHLSNSGFGAETTPELKDQLELVGAVRLASLMSTDEGKKRGDDAAENISGLIEGISLRLLSDGADFEKPPALPLKRAVHELMALNNDKPIGHSNSTNTAIKTLLTSADEDTSTLGRLALSRHQDLFDKSSTTEMPILIDFIKGEEVTIPDSRLAEIAIVADRRLNSAKRNQDSGLIQGSFVNLANHKVFEELLYRIETNPNLSLVMFQNLGESFAPSLYEHSIKDNNDSYAMSLLSHSEHGLLKGSKANMTNDLQVQNLLQLVVKSDNASENISRLVDMSNSPESLDTMLESLSEVHNNHYNSQNLANILDGVGSTMSSDQLKRFGEILVKNHQHQPVLSALQKIIDIGQEKGYEFNYLERASVQIRKDLDSEYQELRLPLTAYSSITIDFPDANASIALRDGKSVPHLRLLIDSSVGDKAGRLDFEVNGSDSLLDETMRQAVNDYMIGDDATALNKAMFLGIRSAEKDVKRRAQFLFEANKQNKSLPPLSLDEINMMSDVAGRDAAVFSGNKELIKLSDFHSSDDILDKLTEQESKLLSIDETGLGKDYDKRLLSALKDCSDNPKDKQKQSDLNELVGLPVTELSSKIENQQSDGNFIKKVTDSLITAVRSPN